MPGFVLWGVAYIEHVVDLAGSRGERELLVLDDMYDCGGAL